jgi:hypothetical protein
MSIVKPRIASLLLAFLLPFAPAFAVPLRQVVGEMVDSLSRDAFAGKAILSKAGVGVLAINADPGDSNSEGVGDILTALVEASVGDSLSFYLVDHGIIKQSLAEIELALSGVSGRSSLAADALEEASYLITGTVSRRGDEYMVSLSLVETESMKSVATAGGAFPASALVVYGDALSKPFGFYGLHSSVEWATHDVFGPMIGSIGFSAILPLGRAVYVRPGVEAVYAEYDRLKSATEKSNFGFSPIPPGANKVLAIFPRVGMGFFVPLSRDSYGHLGIDMGFGIDWKSSLYQSPSGPGYLVSDFSQAEYSACLSVYAGMAWRLFDRLALDLELGLSARTYGLELGPDSISGETEGGLNVPLRIAIGMPF